MSIIDEICLFNPPIRGFLYHDSAAIRGSSAESIPMNWRETSKAHVFDLFLPGLAGEDMKLEVIEGKLIRVSAERTDDQTEHDEKKEKWHYRERSRERNWSRAFRLPENAKVEEISGGMRDGVLTVTVPKEEKNGKRHKERSTVEVSGDGETGHAAKGLGRFVCCKA